jgi:hypothetical protein
MKSCHFFTILILLVVCGCKSRNNEQIPVTVLPPSSAGMAQQKDRQHLQGGSLDADRLADSKIFARLNEVPECEKYFNKVLGDFDVSAYTNCPVGTTFDLGIEIYQDGSVGSVVVDDWTNAVQTPLFIQAIKKSHFPKWSDTMRSIVGQDYFVMWINTGSPFPPGPN